MKYAAICLLICWVGVANAAVARDGTPTFANASGVTSLNIAFPANAHAGSLGLICALSSQGGGFGAAPSGFIFVGAQTVIPSTGCWQKILAAGDLGGTFTVTPATSATVYIAAFAYSGATGIVQWSFNRTTNSTTATANSVLPLLSTDLLVVPYFADGALTVTCSLPTPDALSSWVQSTNICLYDFQLSSTIATNNDSVTLSAQRNNAGAEVILTSEPPVTNQVINSFP